MREVKTRKEIGPSLGMNFGKIYFLSGIILILLFIVVSVFFRNTKITNVSNSHILPALRLLWRGGDKARITIVQFVLN